MTRLESILENRSVQRCKSSRENVKLLSRNIQVCNFQIRVFRSASDETFRIRFAYS
uniref:Uncharacterized protein n=1 Tax=Rhizophagus irregularis (strain DAOM 181602 / DAOM 197198 / MUCL 43194) TaxID=747089 RepID=U9TYS7_RHIID